MKEFTIKSITKKTNVKEFADDLKISETNVYRHINEELDMGIIDKIDIWVKHTDGDKLLEHICKKGGGYFFRDIYREGWKDYKVVQLMLEEFSKVFTAVSDSLKDGVIDSAEERRIDKQWGDLVGVMQSFKRAIKRGEFSEEARLNS